MLGPAPVGCAGDVFEGVVKVEGCHWSPFLRGREYSRLPVVLYHVHVSFADAGVDGACCYLLLAPP